MIAEKRLVIIAYLFLFLISYSHAEIFYESFDTTINTSIQAGQNYTNQHQVNHNSDGWRYNKTFIDTYSNLYTDIRVIDFLDNPNWYFFISKNYAAGLSAYTTYVFPTTNVTKVKNTGLAVFSNYSGTYTGFDGFSNPFNRLIYLFNDTHSLNKNSRISFYLKQGTYPHIIFRTDNTNNTFSLAGDTFGASTRANSDCRYAGIFDFNNYQCCSFLNLSTQVYYNFTLNDVITYCNDTYLMYKPKFKDYSNIREIIIGFHAPNALSGGGYEYGTIDELYLGFNDTANSLPVINSFNLTSNQCINTSNQDSITVNYELDVTDNDGDTLYYSSGDWESNYFYKSFIYSKHKELVLGDIGVKGGETLDKDIFGYVGYLTNNTCEIAYSPYVDGVFDYFTFVQKQGLSSVNGNLVVGYDVFQLSLDSSRCDGDRTFTYTLTNPQNYLVYRTDIWEFSTQGERFNLTFFDSSLDPLFVLDFENIGNDIINVSYVNSTGSNVFLFNISNWYTFALQQYNNTVEMWDIQYIAQVKNATFVRNSNESVKYITIGIGDNTRIFQGGFSHSGMQDVLSWTTTAPTTISGVKDDLYSCLYVTDEVYKDSMQYNYKCIHFAPEICNSQDVDSGTLSGNPIITPLRNIFTPIIDGFGMRDTIEALNWLVFIILFIGLFILIHSFGFAFIVSAGFMLFLSLIGFGSLTHILMYSVLLALGLTPYIVQIFFPIQRGGG